ncbi:MAG: UDP-2,3-diacylglucosamine diphosphatase [Bacteroidales bacterium]
MDKKVYFISDLHLGASTLNDPRETEMRVVRWLDSVKENASAIYMLGDVLDYWFEYKSVVPRGYTRFFGKIAELTDRGIEVHWLIGNHDIWIFDYLPSEIGVKVHRNSFITQISAQRFYLGHGDGEGELTFGFKFIRAMFRNRFCQILYSAVHPRWTVAFADGCSSSSRQSSGGLPKYTADEDNPLVRFACNYNKTTLQPIDYFIFGHQHIAFDRPLISGGRIIVTGDWITLFSYAEFDGETVSLKYFE